MKRVSDTMYVAACAMAVLVPRDYVLTEKKARLLAYVADRQLLHGLRCNKDQFTPPTRRGRRRCELGFNIGVCCVVIRCNMISDYSMVVHSWVASLPLCDLVV